MTVFRLRPILLAGASCALALGLTACKIDNRPLLARNGPAAPADYAYAPDASALPYAQPAQVLPVGDAYDGYALAQRAYAHDRVAYRSPPEYGFRYGDVEPWVWQADDDLMFAEPIDDGYRFYYYEPGASYPYFVRDPEYGYAYGDGGVLMALFDTGGAILPQDRLYRSREVAGRYLARGQDLRQVYYREPRVAVAEPVWSRRAPVIAAAQAPWLAGAERQPAFRDGAFRDRPFRDRDVRDREIRDGRVALAEPPRAFENRGFRGHEDRRAFAPLPAPAPQFAQRDVRGDRGREPAPNVFEHQAQASARVEDHPARDLAREQRRQAMDPARAARQAAGNDIPAAAPAFDRRGGGRPQDREAQPQPAPQAQAFNAPRGGGGGNGHRQDRQPAPNPPAAPAQAPQPNGGGHGHGGGDKGGDRHDH